MVIVTRPWLRSAVALALACLWSITLATPPAPAASPQSNSRDCPGQQLSCEQLVALGLTYPYPRQPSSYLFVNGVAYAYAGLGHQQLMAAPVRAGDATVAAKALLNELDLGTAINQVRTPVIAYGSNANAAALTRNSLPRASLVRQSSLSSRPPFAVLMSSGRPTSSPMVRCQPRSSRHQELRSASGLLGWIAPK